MRLLLLYPEVARRSCDDCRTWLYNDRGGEFGERMERKRGSGIYLRRPVNSPTPCYDCPKIPPEVPIRWTSAVELTDQTRQAYQFYCECKAVGHFPDDPIVRLCASTIRRVEDSVGKQESRRTSLTIIDGLLKGGLFRGR